MRTTRFTLALLATLTIQLCVAMADSPEEVVEKAVAKFRSGDESDLANRLFRDAPEKSAAAFLKHVPSFAKDTERSRLMWFAAHLLPPGHSDTNAPSGDRTLIAERLVAIVETDESSTLRSGAADRLQVLFSPQFLDGYAKSIRNAARHWKQEAIFVLMGMLPSCNKEDMQIILDAIKAEEPGYYSLDGILARHGDVEAEKRLMEAAMIVTPTRRGDTVYFLVTPLSQARTEKMKLFLANGLRCEDILEMAGGSYMPRRDLFARALVKMMRGDPTFPVKVEDCGLYDEQLDKIEQWCKEHLGIKIPSTPLKSREKLFSEAPKPTGVE